MDRRAALRLQLALIVAWSLYAPRARAQVWVAPEGPQGEAWLSVGYGNNFIKKHFLGTAKNPGDNVETDRGHIRSQAAGFELGYNVTNRLALSVALPYVDSKYYGPQPHEADTGQPVEQDDGRYHGTFADWGLAVRYRLVEGEVTVMPFAGGVIPSHAYAYYAHAAAGRDLWEIPVGVTFSASLQRLLEGSYFQTTYSYSFVEKIAGIHHDRSDVYVEMGYEVLAGLAIRAIGNGHYTHGGLIFKNGASIPPELWIHHDQIDKSSGINLGGGLSYQLTGSVDLYASYLTTVMGRGGHKLADGIGFGFTWAFSPKQLVRRYFSTRQETP